MEPPTITFIKENKTCSRVEQLILGDFEVIFLKNKSVGICIVSYF